MFDWWNTFNNRTLYCFWYSNNSKLSLTNWITPKVNITWIRNHFVMRFCWHIALVSLFNIPKYLVCWQISDISIIRGIESDLEIAGKGEQVIEEIGFIWTQGQTCVSLGIPYPIRDYFIRAVIYRDSGILTYRTFYRTGRGPFTIFGKIIFLWLQCAGNFYYRHNIDRLGDSRNCIKWQKHREGNKN